VSAGADGAVDVTSAVDPRESLDDLEQEHRDVYV
jgi:hypothetical protein